MPAQLMGTASTAGASPRRRTANLFDRTGTLLYKMRTCLSEPSAGRGDRNAKAVHPRACAWIAPGCGGNRARELRRRSRQHWYAVVGTTAAPNITVPVPSRQSERRPARPPFLLVTGKHATVATCPPPPSASATPSAIRRRSRRCVDRRRAAIDSRRARRRPFPRKAG